MLQIIRYRLVPIIYFIVTSLWREYIMNRGRYYSSRKFDSKKNKLKNFYIDTFFPTRSEIRI